HAILRQVSVKSGAGFVILLCVLAHHAGGVEEGAEGSQRRLHEGDPAPGKLAGFTVVKEGKDLVFQEVVNRLAFHRVLVVFIRIVLAAAYGPAALVRVGFVPPAIEDAEVEDSVGSGFHSARAARLQGPPRRVEPEIDSLNQVPGDTNVVI